MPISRCDRLSVVLLTACLAVSTTSSHALAEEAGSNEEEETVLDLILGGGIDLAPDYEGSDDYEASLFPYAELSLYDGLASLSVEGAAAALPLGESTFIGIGVAYDEGRDEDDNDALDGLGDVDDTVTGSIAGGLVIGPAEFSLTFTQDLGSGHEGYTVDLFAETGAEIIEDKAEISLGTGITWASDNYTESFFGVDASQAAASGLDEFDADAGFKNAAIELGFLYALTDDVYAGIEASYERLLGDAADSPIVDDLSCPNQFSGGLFLAFELGLL